MIFRPEQYRIADKSGVPFIDKGEIENFLSTSKPDKGRISEIIAKSIQKNRLSLEEVACLLNANNPEEIEQIKEGAKKLKEEVYGNRIVLFAPLYIGNYCINDCQYCGFRTSNKQAERSTISGQKLIDEVEVLEDNGQKRLILVFGEHPKYNPQFIADTARTVYSVKKGNGEIRRVNINAAPLTIEGFRTVKEAGIGIYKISPPWK
jgi:2-iminoacetate synthase